MEIMSKIKSYMLDLRTFVKWVLFGILVGAIVGLIGTLFHYSIEIATSFRMTHWYVILFLPIVGILIVALYHLVHMRKDQGTNLVLLSIREATPISFKTAPLIFIATTLTHLCGGSSGREGAALQLGSSLSYQIGKLFQLDEKDLHIMTMCGMSAGFSALFGTPLAAAIFAMEVISVGIMHYAALVPCSISALIAYQIAGYLHIMPTKFHVTGLPELGVLSSFKILLLAFLGAVVSMLFCEVLHYVGHLYKRYIANSYLRILTGSLLILGLTAICQTTDYLGAGMSIITAAIEGEVVPWAFLLKLIFTALTLGAGFKGGEIVPAFFVGATFGHVIAPFLGLSSSFGGAIGLITLFCGVTNCPITSFILSIELFGSEGSLFFMLACSISYMTSGYTSLYAKQKIMYSKQRPEFINQLTN